MHVIALQCRQSVLQCVVVCCSVPQVYARDCVAVSSERVAVCRKCITRGAAPRVRAIRTGRCTKVKVLQCVGMCCSLLRRVAGCYGVLHGAFSILLVALCLEFEQCRSACCSECVLLCVCVAVCFSVCVTHTHCNTHCHATSGALSRVRAL